MKYTTRPLSDRTWLRPAAQRQRARFDAKWAQTLKLLEIEIDKLGGRDVVIEVDVTELDLRQDGMLRSRAQVKSPAVVVAFDTDKHGPMLYRCDRFAETWYDRPGWQENVRAIALTLESLRAVDRYGATETGQQYAGFKALPAGRAMPASHMTITEARHVLVRANGYHEPVGFSDAFLYKRARRLTHPDHHAGDRSLWDQVEQAAKALGLIS